MKKRTGSKAPQSPDRIVRPAEVCRILGISRSSIYRMVKRGDLPAPIRVSPGASGWRESTIADYLDQREAATG